MRNKEGIFCISIDFELLWGRKDTDYQKFISLTKKERPIIKSLLKLFNKYQIPATWATVGILEKEGDKNWSAPEIIKSIKKYKIHEIGSHTYSHEIFDEISPSKANSELNRFKAKSLVFPRNKIKYLNLLKKNGFTNFRGKDKTQYELLIPRVPPTGKIKINSGVIEIPSSMYFVSSRGIRKYIPKNLRFFKSKLGINQAIKNKEIFHLWFHPVDFAVNTKALLNEFEKILIYANKMRSEGKLQILTMREVAKK